jgi:uncharacterized protein (TIGR02996 family)
MSLAETLHDLQQAIFVEPDADAPRLDYANHVEAVSRPRAELIRRQIKRHRDDLAAGRMQSVPTPEERKLLAAHGAEWAAPFDEHVRAPRHDPHHPELGWHRGFIEMLRTDAGVLVTLGDRLLRLGPIRHLALDPDGTSLAEVLATPALEHLVSLDLGGWHLGDDGARALAQCPHFERLAWLGLTCAKITEHGIDTLAGSPRLRKLVTLDLHGNPFAASDLAADPQVIDRLERSHGTIPWLHPLPVIADRYHVAEVARRHAEFRPYSGS